jgi:hypothetical protein
MSFNNEPIRDLVSRSFLVVARERLEYISADRPAGSSGGSGTSGYSGSGQLLGLKTVELVNYKAVKLEELSRTGAYIRVRNLTWNDEHGTWYTVDNFLEAYELIEEI